eukprot:1280236-Prymnesium_polylepis.1
MRSLGMVSERALALFRLPPCSRSRAAHARCHSCRSSPSEAQRRRPAAPPPPRGAPPPSWRRRRPRGGPRWRWASAPKHLAAMG